MWQRRASRLAVGLPTAIQARPWAETRQSSSVNWPAVTSTATPWSTAPRRVSVRLRSVAWGDVDWIHGEVKLSITVSPARPLPMISTGRSSFRLSR